MSQLFWNTGPFARSGLSKLKKLVGKEVKYGGSCERYLATAASREKTVEVKNTLEEEYANAKPFESIPGPRSFPVLGSGWTFLPYIGTYELQRLNDAAYHKYRTYGSLVKEDITAGTTILNVYDPDDIEKVSRNEGATPLRLPFISLNRIQESKNNNLTSKGLLNAEGEEWYNLRSAAQPHMSKPRNVINYLNAMDQVAIDFTHRLSELKQANHEIPNLHKELTKWALESIALVGLDTHLGCFQKDLRPDSDAAKLLEAAFHIFDLIYRLEFGMLPFWKKFNTPLLNKFEANILVFNNLALKYLQLAKERLERKKDNPDQSATVLELMLEEPKMTDMMAASIIRDMFVAGSDTTSNTMSFFLYFMAKYPEIQEKVYQEISGLIKSEQEPITEKHLNEIRFTKACLKESQRMLPVTIGFSRKAGKNLVLSGYQVPKGTVVIVQMMVSNNLEEYHKDANSFKPERWLRGSEDQKSTHPFLFLPFGFGPRACIGRRIAEQELYSVIIRVMSRYRLEYHHEDIGLFTRLTNIPDKPLRFEFYDR